MRTHFLVSTAVLTDPALNAFIPRATRKTLRLPMRKTTDSAAAHTTLTNYIGDNTTYRTDAYHNQNLFTQEHGDDEFGDSHGLDDFELECADAGLTITEPMDEVELWKFCTGYDVI